MRSSIFQEIRQGFASVAAQASHVKIRHDRLENYANSLPSALPPENVFDAEHHYQGDAEATCAYAMLLDAINFGSGYKLDMASEGWKLVEGSTYYSISTRLKDAFEKSSGRPPAFSGEVNASEIAEILELPLNGIESRIFAALCATSWREVFAEIEKRGSYLSFINEAGGSSEKFVRALSGMPSFRDVHLYKGEEIPFYKRAQIMAADLHLALAKSGIHVFNDLSEMTMFADNGVPHVLKTDGILEYDDRLAERISNRDIIPSGSEEEIELRACAGHVVELLARLKNLTPVNIDHILWHRNTQPEYRAIPSHRTKSIFY